MEAILTSNEGEKTLNLPTDESGFYEVIAREVSSLEYPNTATINVKGRKIVYSLEERGGTCNIQEVSNDIRFKVPSTYPKKYLTYADFISAEKKAKDARGELKLGGDTGSYKFYSLESENGKIKASWGSLRGIGREKSCYYENSMYWIKFYEKINKGYIDNSEAYVEKENEVKVKVPKLVIPKKPKTGKEANKASQTLYALLLNAANGVVNSMIKRTVKEMHVTEGMVNESKKYLDELYVTTNLDKFNEILLKLCMVCPRKVWDMKTLMAKTESEMEKVLEREDDLVKAMEGLLLKQKAEEGEPTEEKDEEEEKLDPFKKLGIIVKEAGEEAKKIVRSMLPDNLWACVVEIYEVSNPIHDKRFDDYCTGRKITVKKLFWHGSSNCNWLSIIVYGLLLKKACLYGMFGGGIYTAPKAQKSLGYTDGGYWRGGTGDYRILGIYETAYGNPYHPTRGENWNYTEDKIKALGADCIHAKGNTCGLLNDEVVFYNEAALHLKYIVKFAM